MNRDLPLVTTEVEAATQSQVLHTLVNKAVSAVTQDAMQRDLSFVKRFFPAMRHYMPLYGDVPQQTTLELWNQFHTAHDPVRGVPTRDLVHLWETTEGREYIRARNQLPTPSPFAAAEEL